MDFIGWGGKAVRAFARMPTHAVRLHEWASKVLVGFVYGPPAPSAHPRLWFGFMYGPPAAVRAFARMPTHAVRLHEWGTRVCGLVSCVGHPPPEVWVDFYVWATRPPELL